MTNELAQCLWWNGLAPPPASVEAPAWVDVAIVGGGYTGLAAARALARSGATVAVLDRETIGWGASGRNGGMVLPGYKAELADLVRRYGQERARALFEDSLAAIAFVETLIRDEAIDCDFRRSGHVTLAARPTHLKGLEATQTLLWRGFGYRTELLDRAALSSEIGSDRYHGGLLDPLAGQIQPAQYVTGLARAAARAGAVLVEQTAVRGIARSGPRFRLTTSRGIIEAGGVLLATNGYTGTLLPWLSRRVVPVGSYIIATERLSPELRLRLIPRGRMLSDTKNLLYYFRLSPDGRLVFGGRAAFVPTALDRSLRLLQRGMLEVFPELATTRVEYSWGGTLGFTLDQMPHSGQAEGVFFALGYGGHGVALASWMGERAGMAMAGKAPWPQVAQLPFSAVPLYRGRPWFLPLAGAYYGLKDWMM